MPRGVVLLIAAVTVFGSRALFLPQTLEDIDSLNFALALENFDPRQHQPHPPGYPVFIALAKVVHLAVPAPARALALVSALAQAALVVPLVGLFLSLASNRERAFLAVLLTLANPLLWFNGARPLSDSVGLLFIITAQALLLRSDLPAGSFLAGLSAGVRLQAALLTIPLWLYRVWGSPGSRTRAWLALLAGGVVWAIPLLVLSGGPFEYFKVFSETIDDALPVEPLVAGFTLNRAARTVIQALISPWGAAPLGLAVVGLASVGFLALGRERRSTLGLALLAFGPYLVVHVLFQQVRVLRYSLPYVPLFAWLAVEGIGWLSDRGPARAKTWVVRAAAAALVITSASLTLPALREYHRTPSPPYAALQTVAAQARPPEDFVLASHYMFNRYLGQAPPGLTLLPAKPRRELQGLQSYWASGARKNVLFLSHPDRTDLEMMAPGSRHLLGRWEWSSAVMRFLSGARPVRAELFRIERPDWYAGPGWMISDESGSIAQVSGLAERPVFLSPLTGPAFLMMSGEALSADAGEFELELRLAGDRIDTLNLGGPLLRGYMLPSGAAGVDGYLTLAAETRRAGRLAGAPFLLKGFEYGPVSQPGFVHGEGWFLPERDEELRSFRWTSTRGRSLLHVPGGGARLFIQGVAPLEYLGPELSLSVAIQGQARLSTTLRERRFELELPIPEAGLPFRELILSVERGFIPDEIQRNGDRRRLALRVYRFEISGGNSQRSGSPERSGPR